MSVKPSDVKKLRDRTGASMMECKKALEESSADIDKAIDILRKKGETVAEKKSSRQVQSGIIEAYIHPNNRVGVLLELVCETDFVARNSEFKELAHNIAMQIAAMNPLHVSPEDIPQGIIDKEKEIYLEQFKDSGKPKDVLEKIIEGKLVKFREEKALVSQPYIKDQDMKIGDLITAAIAKLGENIKVKRFSRFEI